MQTPDQPSSNQEASGPNGAGSRQVNTGGGQYLGDGSSVNTGGGDFAQDMYKEVHYHYDAPPPPPLKPPFMAERLPAEFVQRPNEFEPIVQALLNGGKGPAEAQAAGAVGITAALKGAGGYGKTLLARAVCHDPRVKAAFPDGILWVTLGETPDNLAGKVNDLSYLLTHERPQVTDLNSAAAYLRQQVTGKRVLLVVDDVWNAAHLRPFLLDSPGSACLITTRNGDLLPAGVGKFNVDQMRAEEAAQLIRSGLPEAEAADLRADLQALTHRLGEWPLLLGLANGRLRAEWEERKSLARALHYTNKAYDRLGLTAFNAYDPQERSQAADKVIRASIDHLKPEDQARFAELAVFPEDVALPWAALAVLWGVTGQLDEEETEDLCRTLWRRSLVQQLDDDQRALRLHDVMRKYLVEQAEKAGPERPRGLHEALLEGYAQKCGRQWSAGPEDGYYFRWLVYHLAQAGQTDELPALLLDYDWIAAHLRAGGVGELLGDYEVGAPMMKEGQVSARRVQGAIRMAGHILGPHPEELAGQLWGRLLCFEEKEIKDLLEKARQRQQGPWLRPLAQCFNPPGSGEVRTLSGHTRTVNAVAISPDGRLIISASGDRTLKVWDLASGQERHSLRGHTKPVNVVAISPDDSLAISASSDYTLKVWDLASGQERHSLRGHSAVVLAVAISPDGRLAVSASWDSTLKVWDLASGQERYTLKGHRGGVCNVAISPDGRLAVSASWDSTLKVWDLASGQERHSLSGHKAVVLAVAISSNGHLAVSASDDRTLKVWDLANGQERHILKGHTGSVNAVAISPDGRMAVSASSDNTLKIWDLVSGQERHSLSGHNGVVIAVAISLDGRLAVSASGDRTIKVWDLDSGQERHTLRGHTGRVHAVAISPDGRLVISASSDNTLKIWDLAGGQERHTLKGHIGGIHAVAISPDGCLAISPSDDRTLKVWDLTSGQERQVLKGHTGGVRAVAIHPSGCLAISASNDNTLKIWDLVSGQEQHTLKGHSGGVFTVVITPDGRLAVSASSDNSLKVWDLASGQELHSLKLHTSWVLDVAVSPDGRLVISASDDRTLKVWDLASGHELYSLKGHSKGINAVVVSPDGQMAISASSDETLKVWDLTSGQELHSLKGHSKGVHDVAISPDGRLAVSASSDNTLKVWDLASGQEVHTLKGHENGVYHVSISSNGRLAVSISADKTMKVWDLQTGRMLASFSCNGVVDACQFYSDGERIIAGDWGGGIYLLALEGLETA